MTKAQLDALLPLSIPREVAVCPICGSDLQVEEVTEWYESSGKVVISEHSTVDFDCVMAPDIDDSHWDYWFKGHWSMPYVDWLPLQKPVKKWLNETLAAWPEAR